MSITITGIKELQATLGQHARQAPYAVMNGLNKTAYEVLPVIKHEMKDSFDRPTPYTLSGVRYRKATKENLEADIYISDERMKTGIPQAKYLRWEIHGGTRRLKRFEESLRAKGILPSNKFCIPASGAKIDAYGNMAGGQIVQILAFFEAFGEQGYKSNMADKDRKRLKNRTYITSQRKRISTHGVQYFVIHKDKRLQPGIYMRARMGHGNAIKPVLLFVERAHYEERFDFHDTVQRAAQDLIGKNISESLSKAIATAR